MRDHFYDWARAEYEARGCDDEAYVHPNLARQTKSVSGDFSKLLEVYKIGERQDGFLEGDRKGQRTKTFHSVRRAAATLIHAAGFSETMAMKLVGHKSAAVHEVYVKPDVEQLRALVERMPGS
jgi:integrase